MKTNDKEQQKPRKTDNQKEEDSISEEEDLSWIQGLSRWPLYPPSPKEKQALDDSTTQVTSDRADRGGFIPIPLANLINVEAILALNGEETLDSTQDLEMLVLNETTTAAALADINTTTLEQANATANTNSPLSILPDLQELAKWEELANTIRQSVADAGSGTSAVIGGITDAILKEASSRIEFLVNEASTAISPSVVQDLVQRAGRALSLNSADDLSAMAQTMARQQGLNVSEAAERAKQTTEYTTTCEPAAPAVEGDSVRWKEPFHHGWPSKKTKVVVEMSLLFMVSFRFKKMGRNCLFPPVMVKNGY